MPSPRVTRRQRRGQQHLRGVLTNVGGPSGRRASGPASPASRLRRIGGEGIAKTASLLEAEPETVHQTLNTRSSSIRLNRSLCSVRLNRSLRSTHDDPPMKRHNRAHALRSSHYSTLLSYRIPLPLRFDTTNPPGFTLLASGSTTVSLGRGEDDRRRDLPHAAPPGSRLHPRAGQDLTPDRGDVVPCAHGARPHRQRPAPDHAALGVADDRLPRAEGAAAQRDGGRHGVDTVAGKGEPRGIDAQASFDGCSA